MHFRKNLLLPCLTTTKAYFLVRQPQGQANCFLLPGLLFICCLNLLQFSVQQDLIHSVLFCHQLFLLGTQCRMSCAGHTMQQCLLQFLILLATLSNSCSSAFAISTLGNLQTALKLSTFPSQMMLIGSFFCLSKYRVPVKTSFHLISFKRPFYKFLTFSSTISYVLNFALYCSSQIRITIYHNHIQAVG